MILILSCIFESQIEYISAALLPQRPSHCSVAYMKYFFEQYVYLDNRWKYIIFCPRHQFFLVKHNHSIIYTYITPATTNIVLLWTKWNFWSFCYCMSQQKQRFNCVLFYSNTTALIWYYFNERQKYHHFWIPVVWLVKVCTIAESGAESDRIKVPPKVRLLPSHIYSDHRHNIV